MRPERIATQRARRPGDSRGGHVIRHSSESCELLGYDKRYVRQGAYLFDDAEPLHRLSCRYGTFAAGESSRIRDAVKQRMEPRPSICCHGSRRFRDYGARAVPNRAGRSRMSFSTRRGAEGSKR